METEEHAMNMMMKSSSRFKHICVFCGTSPSKNPNYQLAAIQLTKQLVMSQLNYYFFFLLQFGQNQIYLFI